jgi:glycosyltransferase involved in cell wall biosynthesis
MKISIGSKIIQGPWGGGNLFAINLSNYLKSNGHCVTYDLSDPDIDLILLTDPRSRSESSSTFNHIEIEKYKKYVNPNVAVVQRINECDERKNTNNINKFYLDASESADHVVFVSSWLRNIYTNIGMNKDKTSVILAGANKKIFNSFDSSLWNKKTPIKIVTHHWSAHMNKGFEIYQQIDNMLSNEKWKNKIEFTYIGNLNEKYKFNNTKCVKPLAGLALSNELKKHHIYVTASINEPSGNHHIEAAQCGLPILYKESGGIPEYCKDYGVGFVNDFEPKLDFLISNYEIYKAKLKQYPFNSDKMCDEFYHLFEVLIEKKKLDRKTFKRGIVGNIILLRNKIINKIRRNVFTTVQAFFTNTLRKMRS